MKTWITDVRHLPIDTTPGVPAVAVRRRAFVHELVEAATSRRGEEAWCTATRCIARVGRKLCGARVHVEPIERGRLAWSCVACGECGEITGFEATAHDLSSYALPARKKPRLWGFDDESRDVLRDATTHIPSLRAVVARAYPAADVDGLFLVQATMDELDAIYTLVEELEAMTRSRRRLDLLEGLRFSLSTAIDGF